MAYNALKGVHDIFPPDVFLWQNIESIAKDVFAAHGFLELRVPIIESTDVFIRSIGETTDIVEKEMYTFSDKAGRRITLRPEGTAPVVRCYVEHHLFNLPAPQKFFYSGPMFRYERPQSGRFRQFYQIGAEAFGIPEPKIDAEILSLLKLFFERLGLNGLNFEINSIGCEKCRPDYRKALTDFLLIRLDGFCPDCKRRFNGNPLRILDCKVETCKRLREGAPLVTSFLCSACEEHFHKLLSYAALLGIPFRINPEMVRGLDYYTRTTFEVTCTRLGAQNAVAAGGRYDRLVEDFGGPPTPAIGFAVGMERVTSLLKLSGNWHVPSPKVFIAVVGEAAEREGLALAVKLRLKGVWVELGYSGNSLKSQMRRADRLGAEYLFILGDNELGSGKLQWKSLSKGVTGQIGFDEAETFLKSPPHNA